MTIRILRPLLLALLVALPAQAQAPVRYEITFPNLVHHEARISITFEELPAEPLLVRMSRSSPGRYALHEFAKNVYSVSATDGAGRELRVSRPDPHSWRVEGHDGSVTFRYTLFGARADGTYTGIDNTHAHLNMPATFAWAQGLELRPIEIRFERPRPGWRIATQLVPTAHPERFTAPDLRYFLDSPTEISDHDLRSWTIEHGGRRQTIRLAVHHEGEREDVDEYERMLRLVVDEQIAVFGEPPTFDHGSYVFIACYTPWVAGDGMEHRNSTILTSTRPLATGALQNLGTASHEFIHAWNVERLRPRSLEPFDFTAANMSGELWFAEGFTSYYGPYTIRRAGLTTDEQYAATLGGMLNTVINAPGRSYFSPVEMSMQAPFVDAAVSIDPTNRVNTFLSYYAWGAAIGLGLDLTLRTRFGLTLDDYMRHLWRDFGRSETPYTHQDLRAALGTLTGDPEFAHDFFARYVEGRDVPDFATLLSAAGFLVRRAQAGLPWLGVQRLEFRGDTALVAVPTLVGSPLYEAGVSMGSLILRLDGRVLDSEETLEDILDGRRPGDTIEIEFEQRGEVRTASMVLAEDPRLEVVTFESAGRTLTPEMARLRAAWLERAR